MLSKADLKAIADMIAASQGAKAEASGASTVKGEAKASPIPSVSKALSVLSDKGKAWTHRKNGRSVMYYSVSDSMTVTGDGKYKIKVTIVEA